MEHAFRFRASRAAMLAMGRENLFGKRGDDEPHGHAQAAE
jgi:hypothetical protein